MTPEEFRKHGRDVIDWIADYMEQVEEYPVLSQVAPGDVRASLPVSAPQQGESFDEILADVKRVILPGITHWQSPNFFGYFPANTSPPSILGELLAAGLGVQGMLWTTSPACTELEQLVLDWLIEMLDLPPSFHSAGDGGGVIQDTASSASLCALLAACHRQADSKPHDTRHKGIDSWQLAYTSDQAHSSIEKAMMIAGMGTDRLRVIESDAEGRMRPDRLEQQMAVDASHGLKPTLAPRHPVRSIRWPRSAASAMNREPGCMSTRRWPARRRCVLSSVTCTMVSSWPTAMPSTRTSGCSSISTATASSSPTDSRCCRR